MLGCSIQRNKEDQNEQVKEKRIMSTNKQSLVPNAREALNKFKMEAANEAVSYTHLTLPTNSRV